MPSLNFKKEFAPLIEKGFKRQTIRPERKNPIKAGDRLFLFTGLRTKNCINLKPTSVDSFYRAWDTKNLNWYVTCKSIDRIKIKESYSFLLDPLCVNDNELNREDMNYLADREGFKSIKEFVQWIEKQYGLPFEGVIIKW